MNKFKILSFLIILSTCFAVTNNTYTMNQKSDENEDLKKCLLCLDDKNKNSIYKMNCCGAEFCNDCLNENINHAINSNDLNLLRCPNITCRAEISEIDARAIVKGDMKKLNTFNELKLKKTLAIMPGIKHCPTEGCDAIFINEPDKDGVVSKQKMTCEKCNKSYCANCLKDHNPEIDCEKLKQKERANLDPKEQERLKKEEAETAKIVKDCPQCKCPIEKDGGCYHITCKKCGYGFCFYCLKKSDHGQHVCENMQKAMQEEGNFVRNMGPNLRPNQEILRGNRHAREHVNPQNALRRNRHARENVNPQNAPGNIDQLNRAIIDNPLDYVNAYKRFMNQ